MDDHGDVLVGEGVDHLAEEHQHASRQGHLGVFVQEMINFWGENGLQLIAELGTGVSTDREEAGEDRSTKDDFDGNTLLPVQQDRAHRYVPDEVLLQVAPDVLHRLRNEHKRVLLLQELHGAALRVERVPGHVEVTKPLRCVANLVADHVGRPLKEVGVGENACVCLFKTEV